MNLIEKNLAVTDIKSQSRKYATNISRLQFIIPFAMNDMGNNAIKIVVNQKKPKKSEE
jgi:hypothetical protein